jgi:hypothetical protein
MASATTEMAPSTAEVASSTVPTASSTTCESGRGRERQNAGQSQTDQ